MPTSLSVISVSRCLSLSLTFVPAAVAAAAVPGAGYRVRTVEQLFSIHHTLIQRLYIRCSPARQSAAVKGYNKSVSGAAYEGHGNPSPGPVMDRTSICDE